MATNLLLLPFLPLLAFAQDSSARQCYYPNGTASTEPVVPCQPEAVDSICCASTDLCSTNGLCKSQLDTAVNHWWRDSCTDPKWGSRCTQQCFNSTTDPTASSRNWEVFQCSLTTYCCAYTPDPYVTPIQTNYSCCQDSERLFEAGAPAYLGGNDLVFVSSFSASGSDYSPTVTGRLDTSASITMTSTPTATPTFSSTPSSDEGLSTGAKAGIAVGVVVGVLALLAVVIGLLWRKRRQRGQAVPQYEANNGQEKETWQGEHYKDMAEVYTPPTEADSNARAELEGSHMGNKPAYK